jgi:hypothetical protein
VFLGPGSARHSAGAGGAPLQAALQELTFSQTLKQDRSRAAAHKVPSVHEDSVLWDLTALQTGQTKPILTTGYQCYTDPTTAYQHYAVLHVHELRLPVRENIKVHRYVQYCDHRKDRFRTGAVQKHWFRRDSKKTRQDSKIRTVDKIAMLHKYIFHGQQHFE